MSVIKEEEHGAYFPVHKLGFFQQLTQSFGVLPISRNEESSSLEQSNLQIRSSTSTSSSSQTVEASARQKLDIVGEMAEILARDIVVNFDAEHEKKPPNLCCKTMRRVVRDLSDRHDLVFKGMLSKLQPDQDNFDSMLVIVADEIFRDNHVNWGRIIALYTFTARIARYHRDILCKTKASSTEHIAPFVGKYVARKLGNWILDHGGWDAFVSSFPDKCEFEEKLWKGLLFTAIGLGTLATMVASR